MQKAYLAASVAAMSGAMTLGDVPILDVPDKPDGTPQPMIVYPDG